MLLRETPNITAINVVHTPDLTKINSHDASHNGDQIQCEKFHHSDIQ
jgi:hypothetical protein